MFMVELKKLIPRNRYNALFCLGLRIYIGAIFVYASLYKIYAPHSFALSVATYDILPNSFVNPFALILPWLEFWTGLILISGTWVKTSAFIICNMMAMFIIALILALMNNLDLACGCFASSEAEEAISFKTLGRDMVWLSVGLYILFKDRAPIGTACIKPLIGRK